MKLVKFLIENIFNIISALIAIASLAVAWVALGISQNALQTGASETKQNASIEKLTSISQQAQSQLIIMQTELGELKKLNTSTSNQLQLMLEEKEAQKLKHTTEVNEDYQRWLLFLSRVWRAHEDIFFSRRVNIKPSMEEEEDYIKFTKGFMDQQIAEVNQMYIYNKFLAENIFLKKVCIKYRDILTEITNHTEISGEASRGELVKFTCATKIFYAHFYLHRDDANTESALKDFEKRINESKDCIVPGG